MSTPLKLTCLSCGAVNRVPDDKLDRGPKCAKCATPLADGHVHDVSEDILAKAIKFDDLPVLVDFWAPWCGPCRTMAPEFMKAAETLKPAARLVKINTDQYQRVSGRNNIRGIPTMILYKAGREAQRQSGAVPASAIVQFVQQNA